MFNFSANHIEIVSINQYDKCVVYVVKDLDTQRCYKAYDYKKNQQLIKNQVYCISGKVNAADKLYLVLESAKRDNRFYIDH